MRTGKDLVISIVSYNGKNFLAECLDSIIENPPAIEYSVIVVDNASSDGTPAMVMEKYPEVLLIENKKNAGFAAANNQAIGISGSRYILLINSDCRVYRDSINKLLDFMEKNPVAGVAGPKIINTDGSIQPSCRKFPSFFSAAAHSLLAPIFPDNRFSRQYKLAGIKRDKPVKVDWVSGSCMIIRRQALNDTGPLDEKYFMYVEDLDLCYRMGQKGWEVYYCPDSGVMHHIGGSSGGRTIRANFLMQKSVFYFFWKNYRKNIRVLMLPLLFLVLAARFLLSALADAFRKSVK